MKTIHCYVSGKVQGVFYRQETQNTANKLGLTGWVRNLADMRVELVAQGDEEKLAELLAWLHQGPEMAEVTGVEHKELAESETFKAFEVRM